MLQQERNGLTAAAGPPLVPSRSWFEMEEPDEPTGWTVTADGQVYGHAALWNSCHTGKPGRCVTPPKSKSGYSFYRTGLTEVDDGELIPTGRITLGTGHASLTASPAATAEHYDNTGAVVADVTVKDGKHGIWVTGALRPDVTPERIRALRGASLSGDWRSIRGALELLGMLAVNVPGFPVPRAQALTADARQEAYVEALEDNEEILALVAAGTFTEAAPPAPEVLAPVEPTEAEWEQAIAELTAAATKAPTPQDEKIAKVMREFKAGKLKSSTGKVVTNRKQAIAIALSEASMAASADELAEIVELVAATFDESKHKRYGKGDPKGGQFAPKGTMSPDTTEAALRMMSDKQVKDMYLAGNTHENVLAELKSRGYGGWARDRAPLTPTASSLHDRPPPAIARIDPGAQYYGEHPDGTAWMMTTKPPSGIEQDWIAIATKDGKVRRVTTDADFEKIVMASSDRTPPSGIEQESAKKVTYRGKEYEVAREYAKQIVLRDASGKETMVERGKVNMPNTDTRTTTQRLQDKGKIPRKSTPKERAAIERNLQASALEPHYLSAALDSEDPAEEAAPGEESDYAANWSEDMMRSALARAAAGEDPAAIADELGIPQDEFGYAALERARAGEDVGTLLDECAQHYEEDNPDESEPDDDADELGQLNASSDCVECEEPRAFDPWELPARREQYRELLAPAVRAAAATDEQVAAEWWHAWEFGALDALTAAGPKQAQRAAWEKKGWTLPGGRYPIPNRAFLKKAIGALGRAAQHDDYDQVKNWIIKRARALKAVDMLPASWNITASGELQAAGTFTEAKHPREPKGSTKGGQFAPKGTSKVAPRPDEVHDVTQGGKLVYGPGGQQMSRTEKAARAEHTRNTSGPRSRSGALIEPGDMVYDLSGITDSGKQGIPHKVSAIIPDKNVVGGYKVALEGSPYGALHPSSLSHNPPGGSSPLAGRGSTPTSHDLNYAEGASPTSPGPQTAVEFASLKAKPGESATTLATRFKLTREQANEAWQMARRRHLKEGKVVDARHQFHV